MLESWQAKQGSDERGAALVETAILIPVVILVTFGLIEFSSAYQSSSVASALRSSRRPGGVGRGVAPDVRTDAAAAAATALHTIPSSEPVEMWVYKANASGYPSSGNFTTCSTNCIKYTWLPGDPVVRHRQPRRRRVAVHHAEGVQPEPWDSVGVYVKLNHKFLTKLFGATITLTDHAVFRLEPAPTQLCP